MEWRIEHFDEIDSTNTWVGAQALEGAAEGLVALADFQSRGRGRRDRRWEAPAGSALLCSVLLRPAVDLDDVQLGVAVMALALRAALERAAGLHADLKWPNDLLVGNAKVAGLLSEVVATDEGVALVVGLGVNLTSHPVTSSTSVRGATLCARSTRGPSPRWANACASASWAPTTSVTRAGSMAPVAWSSRSTASRGPSPRETSCTCGLTSRRPREPPDPGAGHGRRRPGGGRPGRSPRRCDPTGGRRRVLTRRALRRRRRVRGAGPDAPRPGHHR